MKAILKTSAQQDPRDIEWDNYFDEISKIKDPIKLKIRQENPRIDEAELNYLVKIEFEKIPKTQLPKKPKPFKRDKF